MTKRGDSLKKARVKESGKTAAHNKARVKLRQDTDTGDPSMHGGSG